MQALAIGSDGRTVGKTPILLQLQSQCQTLLEFLFTYEAINNQTSDSVSVRIDTQKDQDAAVS